MALTPVKVSVGVALSLPLGPDPLHTILLYLGLTAAHATVNTLNDYIDFVDGVDRDPNGLHGGSGVLAAGLISPSQVRKLVLFLGVLSLVPSVYFLIIRGPLLLLFLLPASGSVLFYSRILARKGVGPFTAFLNWGPLMVAGTYLALTGVMSGRALFVGVIVGVYVGLLLHLHDLPDYSYDKAAGKTTLAVAIGLENSVRLAYMLLFLPYGLVALGLAIGFVDVRQLVIFAAFPVSVYLLRSLRRHGDSSAVQKIALLSSLLISGLIAISLAVTF